MMNQYPYLFWLSIFVFLPSILIWAIYWNFLKKYFRLFVFITIFAFVWGIFFDIVGSSLWHIWFYTHNLNLYFLGLPLEEYLILLFLPQELAAILLLIRKKIYG